MTAQSGYPRDWARISYAVRARASWRCETCGARHLAWGWRDALGRFCEVPAAPLIAAGHRKPPFLLRCSDGTLLRIIEIVVAAAHLDHDPASNEPDNLAALCQACHLAHDLRQHVEAARARRRAQMETPDLFATPP